MDTHQSTKLDLNHACQKYFKAWNTNKESNLIELFTDDIVLEDWEGTHRGKDKVILANKNIFDSVKGISAEPINIDILNNVAYCDLNITVETENNSDVVRVIDKITFSEDEQYKITAIKAYKG